MRQCSKLPSCSSTPLLGAVPLSSKGRFPYLHVTALPPPPSSSFSIGSSPLSIVLSRLPTTTTTTPAIATSITASVSSSSLSLSSYLQFYQNHQQQRRHYHHHQRRCLHSTVAYRCRTTQEKMTEGGEQEEEEDFLYGGKEEDDDVMGAEKKNCNPSSSAERSGTTAATTERRNPSSSPSSSSSSTLWEDYSVSDYKKFLSQAHGDGIMAAADGTRNREVFRYGGADGEDNTYEIMSHRDGGVEQVEKEKAFRKAWARRNKQVGPWEGVVEGDTDSPKNSIAALKGTSLDKRRRRGGSGGEIERVPAFVPPAVRHATSYRRMPRDAVMPCEYTMRSMYPMGTVLDVQRGWAHVAGTEIHPTAASSRSRLAHQHHHHRAALMKAQADNDDVENISSPQDEIEVDAMSSVLTPPLPYSYVLPKNYDPRRRRHPVLVVLSDLQGGHRDFEDLCFHMFERPGFREGMEEFGWVLVAPKLHVTAYRDVEKKHDLIIRMFCEWAATEFHAEHGMCHLLTKGRGALAGYEAIMEQSSFVISLVSILGRIGDFFSPHQIPAPDTVVKANGTHILTYIPGRMTQADQALHFKACFDAAGLDPPMRQVFFENVQDQQVFYAINPYEFWNYMNFFRANPHNSLKSRGVDNTDTTVNSSSRRLQN